KSWTENPAAARAAPGMRRGPAFRRGDLAPANEVAPQHQHSWELSKHTQSGDGIPGIRVRPLRIRSTGRQAVAVGTAADERFGAGQDPLLRVAQSVVQPPPIGAAGQGGLERFTLHLLPPNLHQTIDGAEIGVASLRGHGISPLAVCRQPVALTRHLRQPFHIRSEEHTSELQSLAYLVCRLLLEK